VESPTTIEEIRTISQELPGFLMINQIERGKTPLLPVDAFQSLGYKIVAYALTALMASVRAMQKVLGRLRLEGSSSANLADLATFEELDQLMEFPETREWENRFR